MQKYNLQNLEIWRIFKKILKNPFVGFASPFFFGCQVARIRHKKKKKEKTLTYESKQNIAQKKKKKKTLVWNWPLIKVKLAKVHMVNLVFWQKKNWT